VPDCGTQFQGRDICSPLHPLMNGSFIAEGILFAVAILILSHLITRDRVRAAVRVLAVLHGIGFVLVGLFHGSQSGPDAGLIIHVSAAGVGIISANTIAILVGVNRPLAAPAPYRIFSIAVAALGFLSETLVAVSTSTAGLFERGGVYSWLLWSLVTGILLLVYARRRHGATTHSLAA
jgi:hypothetical membrane protein